MYQLSTTLSAAIAAGNPQRVLLEFTAKPDGTAYSPSVVFSNEDIVISSGLQLSAEFNSATDLEIGLCPSAEIRFSMWNTESQLVNFEFGKFDAYLGAKITNGAPDSGAKTKTFSDGLYEFAPLGTFIAHRPDIVVTKIIDVDANDQMTLFDEDMPSGAITYPTTLAGLATALCTRVGVTLKTSTFLNSTMTVSAEPEQFENATMREIIGWIAEAAGSIARFDRNGQLEFAWFNTVNQTYDEHSYKEFTPVWYETQAVDGLHIRNADSTEEYVYGTGTNAYMIQDNPFLRQSDAVTTDPEPVITANPSSTSVTVGSNATFTVTATDAESYQWYYLAPTATAWTAVINNGTSATYTLTTAARHDGYKYRCKVSNTVGSVMSSVATLTVITPTGATGET